MSETWAIPFNAAVRRDVESGAPAFSSCARSSGAAMTFFMASVSRATTSGGTLPGHPLHYARCPTCGHAPLHLGESLLAEQ
jgi:hypothetical protein